MPCTCKQCLQHARTLGLGSKVLTQTVIRKAFRSEAKRWHPDRFENQPVERHEAEEHFKLIQVAYRELWEHCESPRQPAQEEPVAAQSAANSGAEDFWTGGSTRPHTAGASGQAAGQRTQAKEEPGIFFGGAHGCFTAARFPSFAWRMVLACRLEESEQPLAFIDFTGSSSVTRRLGECLLVTTYRIFVRDVLGAISLLWYYDLGKLRFVDTRRYGKSRLWRWFVGTVLDLGPKYCLQIGRRDGTIFYTLPPSVDDTAHKVLYNFLQQKKPTTH